MNRAGNTLVVIAVVCMLAVALSVILLGCTTPEPRIITKEVKVAVPVPCKPNLGPRPGLLTKDQIRDALEKAQSLDEKVRILTTQALLYIGWVPVVESALAGCGGGTLEQTPDARG